MSSRFMLLFASITVPLVSAMSLTVTPSIPSPAPIATLVTFTASVPDAAAGSVLWYRFHVHDNGDKPRLSKTTAPREHSPGLPSIMRVTLKLTSMYEISRPANPPQPLPFSHGSPSSPETNPPFPPPRTPWSTSQRSVMPTGLPDASHVLRPEWRLTLHGLQALRFPPDHELLPGRHERWRQLFRHAPTRHRFGDSKWPRLEH